MTRPRRWQRPGLWPWLWRWRWHLAALSGLGLVRALWQPSAAVCYTMTTATCIGVAALVVGSAGVAGSVCRALWLAARTRGAVAALAPVAAPGELTWVVMRLGLGEVCCVAGARRAAFCAGIIRPRVYLTLAMAEAPPDELAAVLAHEAAHAARWDPLRRALTRAVADVFCWLPLVLWWAGRAIERCELRADRVAIARVGAGPVARALIAASDGGAPGPGTAFEGVGPARVAQLLGEDPPRSRPSLAVCVVSVLGLVVLVSLVLCLGQAALLGLTS